MAHRLSDEFMRRLAAESSKHFPVNAGETFEQYVARVRMQPTKVRAMCAARLVKVSRQMGAERQVAKNAWLIGARLGFNPGPRQSCKICGKYISLTHAHHVLPLAVQFEAGATNPIHEHWWLCPTHHAAEHVAIDAVLRNTGTPTFEGMPAEEKNTLLFGPDAGRFVTLLTKLPHWQAVLKT